MGIGTRVASAVATVVLILPVALMATASPANAQLAGNTIAISTAAVSAGEAVVVSGHNAASCAGGSMLEFQPAVPLPGGPALLLFPAPAASESWTYDFAVPSSLALSRRASVPVTPGAYVLTNSCLGSPDASAQVTVTASYQSQRFVGMAATPDGRGYWLAQAGGGVYAYGDAGFFGSLQGLGMAPASPIVGMAATPDGRGYWLVASDGGVFCFGDAGFYGSLPGLGVTPDGPIVGMAAGPDGRGYWLLGGDGGIFAFGDAPYLGTAAGQGLASTPYRAIAATGSGDGYVISSEYESMAVQFSASGTQLLTACAGGPGVSVSCPATTIPFVGIAPAASGGPSAWAAGIDGGVFTMRTYHPTGQVPDFYGSLPGLHITSRAPVVGMAATPDGRGYWLVASDGGVFCFGDAGFFGSAA